MGKDLIYFKDNFIDDSLINEALSDNRDFQKIETPGKSFWVKLPSARFLNEVKNKIEELERKEIDVVFSFFREAKDGQDDELRIHNDSIINGQQPDRAGVLYISEDNRNFINGTAFWKHKKYGETFDDSNNTEEFNRLIIEDSNEINKWELKSIIGHKKNRFLSYPCNYFHSKFPKEFKEPRIVFVIFYKIKK